MKLRLRRQLEILGQVHLAPVVYFKTVNEILRRRQFTCCFRSWADKLHSLCCQIYESETSTRNALKNLLADHFLSSLFYGLDDKFPTFFQEKLSLEFDSNLPFIQSSDIDRLRQVAVALKDKLVKIKSDRHEFTAMGDDFQNESFDFSVELLQETQSLLGDLPLSCPVCGRHSDAEVNSKQSQDQQTSTTDAVESTKESESDEFEKLSNDETKKRLLPKQISTETVMEALEAIENTEDCERKVLPDSFESDRIRNLLQQQKQQLSEECEQKMQEMQTQFEQRLANELNKLKARLKSEHKMEMDSVRSRFKFASALERSSMDRSFMGEVGTSPGSGRDPLARAHENLREKEIQIEHLRRSEENLRHILSRISCKVLHKDAEATGVYCAIKEILEVAKIQEKLGSSLIVG